MPNAVAHFDDDFGVAKPVRKTARSSSPKKSGPKRKKTGRSRFRFDFDLHKVARYAAIGMSATVAVGIMVNALLMQKGRHPAPLFAKSIAFGEPAKAPPSAAKAAMPKSEAEPKTVPTPVTAQPEVRSAERVTAPASGSDDVIGRLLQGGSIPTERGDPKSVMEAQRALVKLGFALKPTGTFGPQTKKAIERFEKDHHLPVKGELSRRTIKALAAASGLKIDH